MYFLRKKYVKPPLLGSFFKRAKYVKKAAKIDTKHVIQVFNTKMSCLQSILTFFGLYTPEPPRGGATMFEFEGAGCIFTDATMVLAGYQPKKGVKLISGFGGSRKGGENYFDTAMREVLEELLEIKPSEQLLATLNLEFQPSRVIINGNYIVLQYSLNDIGTLLDIVARFYSHSPIYSDMPFTLIELIFKRKYLKGMEVPNIVLLPLINDFIIDPGFRKDIELVQNLTEV